MSKSTRILLSVLLPLGTFIILVSTFTGRSTTLPLIEIALASVLKFIAILVISVSALLLISKAAQTGSLSAALPLTLPAVIGLLILSPHWSLGIFLSVVAAGHFIHATVAARDTPPPAPDSPDHEPS